MVLPFAILIPDMLVIFIGKIFWPTPADKLLLYVKNNRNLILPFNNFQSFIAAEGDDLNHTGDKDQSNMNNQLGNSKVVVSPNISIDQEFHNLKKVK